MTDDRKADELDGGVDALMTDRDLPASLSPELTAQDRTRFLFECAMGGTGEPEKYIREADNLKIYYGIHKFYSSRIL